MGKVAFVFPGQGAQYAGMGKSLYDKYPAAKAVYDTCGDEEIKTLSFEGRKEDLIATKIAQPAIFMAGLAAALALKERGISPDGAAGFSLGEIPALAYCFNLHVADAYKLVCKRAEVMHECTLQRKGSMTAVLGLPSEAVEKICAEIDGAYPANYNAPGQIVVSFRPDALDALKEAVAAAKGKAMPLQVAGAFHSPLMDEAEAKFRLYLTAFGFPGYTINIPLYANATGKLYSHPKDAEELLAKQINHPVRWQATIEQMIAGGYDTFIETGPGKVLTGMIKKIDKHVRTFNVYDEESLETTVENV